MTRNKSFYDIEFDEATILQNYGVNEVFYLKNLKDRKLFLTCDIDECYCFSYFAVQRR